MRVLHVIETLGVGGAERVLVQMLPALRACGIDSEVAVLRGPYSLQPDLEGAGFRVHRLDRRRLWDIAGGARAIARLARTRDCQVVHANLFFPTVHTALARRLFAREIRTVTNYHNLAYAPGANRPGPGWHLRKALNALAARFGLDARIAVSGPVAAHYARAIGARDIVVIPNPVPVDAIIAEAGAPDAAPAPLRLVLPGRLAHEKGHGDCLAALGLLHDSGVAFEGVFVGDGPMRAAIEADIAARGLGDAVRITGRVDHADLIRIVRSADIVLVPSRYEGFGLTAAEALVLERAVVATRVGGLTDIVIDDETGILVPPRDPAALAAAVAALANDPQRRARLGQTGLAHVRAHFDAPIVAARLAELYRGLTAPSAV